MTTRAFECVEIDPASRYDAGAKLNIPSDQNVLPITAGLRLTWYADETCTGNALGSAADGVASRGGEWFAVELRNEQPPDNATHVLIELTLSRSYNQGAQSRVLFDDVYLVQSNQRLFVPAIASLSGAYNSEWRSDLHLVNRGAADLTAILHYHCLAGATCNARPREVAVPRGGSIVIKDAAATLFQSPNTGGGVEIVAGGSGSDLVITSRLNSRAPQGTFGTDVPAVTGGAIRTIFAGVRNGNGFRTNVGLYNSNEGFLQAIVSVYVDGQQIGTRFLDVVPENRLLQMDLFALVNAAGVTTDNAYARVTTRGGPVIAYVSVIDNATNDSAYSTGVAEP